MSQAAGRRGRRFDCAACIASLQRQGARVDADLAERLQQEIGADWRRALEGLQARLTIHPKQIHRAFADGLGLPYVDMDWIRPNRELMSLLPLEDWRRMRAFPLTRIDRTLEVALADPFDAALPLRLEQDHGLWVSRMYAMPEQVDAYLAFEQVDIASVQRDLATLTPAQVQRITEQLLHGDVSGIAELADRVVALARKRRASDIHIEPLAGQARVRLRIDGELQEIFLVEERVAQALAGCFKVRAELDIAERRLPQDGRLSMCVAGLPLEMRIATTPTVHGEKLCLRLLDEQLTDLRLESLHFTPKILQGYRRLMQAPHGFIAVTGPTGSGKTTTLYASLAEMSDPRINITTIEDPVEYRLGGINQIPVRPKIGLDFGRVLRSVLRQDPDVVLLGEIRDAETAQVAVQAALTGHVVLTSLHTNTALGAVPRLIDMGVPAYLVAQAMVGAVGQRLLRRLCPQCRQPQAISPEQLERLQYTGTSMPDLVVYEPVGCPACDGTGFDGRIPVHELIILDERMRRAIAAGAPEAVWAPWAHETGYRPLAYDGLVKALVGQTTIDEVIRVQVQPEVAHA